MPKRVLVTRPAAQAHPWIAALRAAGWDAVPLPLIAVGPPRVPQSVTQAWERLASYHGVMFVSANAVQYFFAARPEALAARQPFSLQGLRALSTGPGTVAALCACGVAKACILAPDMQAGQFDSEALWKTLHGHVVPGYRMLVVRGELAQTVSHSPAALADGGPASAVGAPAPAVGEGRDWLGQQVVAAGGVVDFVAAYQRCPPALDAHDRALVAAAAEDGSVWLFSSSEAVLNLQTVCPGQKWEHARALATHPRIAAAAQRAGFGVVRQSPPLLDALLASIESLA